MSGALTGDVASMDSPLTGNGVRRVHDPDGTSLVVGPSPLQAIAESNRPTLPAPAHTCVLHQDLVCQRPGCPFAPCWRLPRSQPELAFVMLRYVSPKSCIASCESPTIAWPAVFSTRACRPLALAAAASRASPPGSGTHISTTLAGSERDGQSGRTNSAADPTLSGSESAVCSELTREFSGKRQERAGI